MAGFKVVQKNKKWRAIVPEYLSEMEIPIH